MNRSFETSGSIRVLVLPKVLKDLHQMHATGVLSLSCGQATKRIFFKNGIIIFATSSEDRDRLGEVLLARGIISQSHFDETARQMKETGKKQGTLLVQMGILSPKDLFQGLNLQVREIILSLFTWDQGDYLFSDQLPEQEEIVTLRILPPPLILEGIVKRTARLEAFKGLWDIDTSALRINPDPPWALEDISLPQEARKLILLIEKELPWEKIPPLAGLSADDAASFLCCLSILELVEIRPSDEPGADEAEGEAASPGAGEGDLPDSARIMELAEKLNSLNLYQVLRLDPGAEASAIKEAYIDLARRYHPDRYFETRFDGVRQQINAVFMKINEAYTVLANRDNRAEYDRREIRLEAGREIRQEPDRDSKIAREQFQKGVSALKAGDSFGAVESLRWAVQLNPRNPHYHTWLGAALAGTKKRLHEAEEHCKTAIALDYSNPLFYVHLGQVYRTGRLHQKARKQFETALKLDPAFEQARREMESLSGQEGDKGLLKKILRK